MEKTARGKVLEASTKLFAEKGLAGVSLPDVARAASVEDYVVAELFPSDTNLYEAVLETQFGFYVSKMEAAFDGDAPPAEKVELFAKAMCHVHKEAPYFFPLFYRELLNPSPYFESIVKKNIRHVAYLSDNNIVKGIQKGTFRHEVNPANATMVLAAMFHYYFLASRLAPSLLPEPGNDEEYFSQALKVFLTGLEKDNTGS
jgi:TetR/AcrR family transcriptional regulator